MWGHLSKFMCRKRGETTLTSESCSSACSRWLGCKVALKTSHNLLMSILANFRARKCQETRIFANFLIHVRESPVSSSRAEIIKDRAHALDLLPHIHFRDESPPRFLTARTSHPLHLPGPLTASPPKQAPSPIVVSI